MTEIGVGLPAGLADVDVAGLVVTAGFVDLHSHVNDLAGLRLQALDGVTTALELEAGASPVAAAYRAAAAEGRPLNYGFASSWAQVRMAAVAGYGPAGTLTGLLSRLGDPGWQRPAGPAQLSELLTGLSADLADGALGIGLLLGLRPGRAGERVPAGGRTGGRGGRADLHARPGPDRDGPAGGRRRRRGDRPRGRANRGAHALLPRQQHLAAAHRPGARPGRPGAGRRGPDHHRGLPVRVRDDRDRRRVPRARAARRARARRRRR